MKVDNLTTAGIGLALDAATLRHQAIANNIANVNTPGYVPKELSFATQMEVMTIFFEQASNHQAPDLANFKMALSPVFSSTDASEKVELDMEVASMAQNSVHYNSLVKALSRHYAILSSAVSDGKK